MLFSQVALMLGLHVHAPVGAVFELLAAVFEDLDRIGIADACEIAVAHMGQALNESLVNKIIQELELFRAALHDVADHIANHGFSEFHVIFEVRKGDLRLDHPELGRMALGVTLLGAESGAESIDIAESHAESFAVQLAGYGQIGGLAEEVFLEIHIALVVTRRISGIQSGDTEHFACAFSITGCDQRCMHVYEATLAKEAVDALCRDRTDAEHRTEQVGARAQMCLCAQVFDSMTLLLQRVGRISHADDCDLIGFQLEWLFHFRRQAQRAFHADGTAQGDLDDLTEVGHTFVQDNLQVLKETAVIHFNKGKCLAVTHGAHPAGYGDLASVSRCAAVQVMDQIAFHRFTLLSV